MRGSELPNWSLVFYGQLGLEHALEHLEQDERAGKIDAATARKIRRKLQAALEIDKKLKQRLQERDPKLTRAQAARDLNTALDVKRDALAAIVGNLAERDEPSKERCERTKEFDVFAIPAGSVGAYADVFPHGVPRNAKHIRVSFVNPATGKPVDETLFGGQTWSSEIRGFRPDGSLGVRVKLAGTGVGKPDALKKRWRVVVAYDCP
jgi:hypothetical protein